GARLLASAVQLANHGHAPVGRTLLSYAGTAPVQGEIPPGLVRTLSCGPSRRQHAAGAARSRAPDLRGVVRAGRARRGRNRMQTCVHTRTTSAQNMAMRRARDRSGHQRSSNTTHPRRIVMHMRATATIIGTVVIATVLVTVTFQAVRAEDAAVLLTRAQALFQPLPQEMDTAALPT